MTKYLCHSAKWDCWLIIENTEIEKLSAISEEIRKQLKTDFKLNLSPVMKILKRGRRN